MEPSIRNLLYTRPELYESVYDGADHAVPRMCERLFERHLGRMPLDLRPHPNFFDVFQNGDVFQYISTIFKALACGLVKIARTSSNRPDC